MLRLFITRCFLLGAFTAMLAGCGSSSSSTTATTTSTTGPATATPIPPVATCSSAFNDYFNTDTALDSRWTQIPATGGSIVLSAADTLLVLTSPAHTDLSGTTFTATRMLQSIGGDFTIMTRLFPLKRNIEPSAYQGAGILLWQDENTYARVEIASYDGDSWGVEFDVNDHGTYHHVTLPSAFPIDNDPSLKFNLQLQRQGEQLIAALRPPVSDHYSEVGRYTLTAPLSALQVGLDVVNATSGIPESMGFDWFMVACP